MDDDMMTWLKAEVKDIGKDTDKLLERGASMSDGFDMGVLTGMLNNRDGGFGGNGFASAYADYKSKVYEAHQKMQKGE